MHRQPSIFIGLLALGLIPAVSSAATRIVTSPADSVPGSLRSTINASAAGDTIVFGVGGTITLTRGRLVIERDLKIQGPGPESLTLSGNNRTGIFEIAPGATVSISELTLSEGRETGVGRPPYGDAIRNLGTLTVDRCLLTRNYSSRLSSGCATVGNRGTLFVNRCTFYDNRPFGTTSPGPALWNEGSLTLNNSTFSKNASGLWNWYAVSAAVNNCTFLANQEFGIAAYPDGASVQLRNTICAGNGRDVWNAVVSRGHNLIGNAESSSGWVASDLIGSGASPLDPGLGPLQDNDAWIPTHALLPTSVAIDAGDDAVLGPPDNLTVDQRYYQRRIGAHVDIGAVEFGFVTRLVTSLDDAGAGSLRDTIAAANLFDRIAFAAAVRGTIRLTGGEILIDKPLTIVGPGATQLAISGNRSGRVLHVGKFIEVEVYGLTLTDGVTVGRDGTAPSDRGEDGRGGGILNEGTLALFDCMITTNLARGGHGGDGQIGRLGAGSVIPGNGGDARGGAICNAGGLRLSRCTLLGNVAQGGDGGDGGRDRSFSSFGEGGVGGTAYGGGIWSDNPRLRMEDSVLMENCTLADNHARGGRGGFPGPTAPSPAAGPGGRGFGGALDGTFALESCTISGNSAHGGASPDRTRFGWGTGGGAASEFEIASSARNTIIARNEVDGRHDFTTCDVADAEPFTSWLSLGWNLIGTIGGSSGWTSNDLLGDRLVPLDPLLSPCQDQGGPVWTMCPISGSPALDKGNSALATDARGGYRVIDHPEAPNATEGNGADIGAAEVDSLFGRIALAKSGATVRVGFKSDAGSTYRLQQTSAVTNRVWTDVVSLPGSGRWLEAVDSAATAFHGFYRVQAVPGATVRCIAPALGLVGWWRAEDSALDVLKQNPATLVGVTYAEGKVGRAFNFTAAGQSVMVPASSRLNVGAGAGFTVEGWINPADATTQMPVVEWSGPGLGAHLWISVSFAGFGGPGSLYASLHSDIAGIISTGERVIQPRVWQHIAMTWEAASGAARLYRNGVLVGSADLAGQAPATASPLYLGTRPGGPNFRGLLDELSVYSRALTSWEIQEIYGASGAGKCP